VEQNEIKITVSKDGNVWCAFVGKDLQEGIAGFGDTPKEAIEELCNEKDFTILCDEQH